MDGSNLERNRMLLEYLKMRETYLASKTGHFWQSSAVALTAFGLVFTGLLLTSETQFTPVAQIIVISILLSFSIIGITNAINFRRSRVIHLLTINLLRKELGIDDIKGIITKYWKKYKVADLHDSAGKVAAATMFMLFLILPTAVVYMSFLYQLIYQSWNLYAAISSGVVLVVVIFVIGCFYWKVSEPKWDDD